MALDQVFTLAKKHADRTGEVEGRSMSLGEHLEELRSRLLKAGIGVAIAAGLCFWFARDMVAYIADPMRYALIRCGFPGDLASTDPTLGFGVFMKVGLIASCILAAPWILWQLWQFIAAGLYPSERKCVHILVPFSTVMAFLGVAFSYFIVLPVSAVFFVNFSTNFPLHDAKANVVTEQLSKFSTESGLGGEESAHDKRPKPTLFDAEPTRFPILKEDPKAPKAGQAWINAEDGNLKIATADQYVVVVRAAPPRMLSALPSLEEWVGFASFTTLGIVAIFQIPVVMLVLGWTRLISPDMIAKNRKLVVFGCAIAAAIIAPPDAVSMMVLGLPIYILFEGGLLLMRWVYNKRQREAEDNLEGDDMV